MTTTTRIVLACTAAMMLAPAAAHAGTLDQSQPDGDGPVQLFKGPSHPNPGFGGLAQTFTAGLTGGLDRADLLLLRDGTSNAGVTVQIRNVTTDGSPGSDSDVLAEATIPLGNVPPGGQEARLVAATFDPPAAVIAGIRYAIVAFTSDFSSYRWYQGSGDPYAGGASFRSGTPPPTTWGGAGTDDFAFQTFVQLPPASVTTLASSVNPSVSGQSVTYTAGVAAVAPGPGTPSGSVAFTDGASPIAGCGAVVLSGGQAQCTVTYQGPGTHAIAASYGGSTAFAASDATLSQTVDKAATNLVAAKASRGALKITFSATLTRVVDGGALAGKPITFKIAGATVCSATTNATGKASCSVGGLVIGSGSYTATFAGDGNYLATSATGSL